MANDINDTGIDVDDIDDAVDWTALVHPGTVVHVVHGGLADPVNTHAAAVSLQHSWGAAIVRCTQAAHVIEAAATLAARCPRAAHVIVCIPASVVAQCPDAIDALRTHGAPAGGHVTLLVSVPASSVTGPKYPRRRVVAIAVHSCALEDPGALAAVEEVYRHPSSDRRPGALHAAVQQLRQGRAVAWRVGAVCCSTVAMCTRPASDLQLTRVSRLQAVIDRAWHWNAGADAHFAWGHDVTLTTAHTLVLSAYPPNQLPCTPIAVTPSLPPTATMATSTVALSVSLTLPLLLDHAHALVAMRMTQPGTTRLFGTCLLDHGVVVPITFTLDDVLGPWALGEPLPTRGTRDHADTTEPVGAQPAGFACTIAACTVAWDVGPAPPCDAGLWTAPCPEPKWVVGPLPQPPPPLRSWHHELSHQPPNRPPHRPPHQPPNRPPNRPPLPTHTPDGFPIVYAPQPELPASVVPDAPHCAPLVSDDVIVVGPPSPTAGSTPPPQ